MNDASEVKLHLLDYWRILKMRMGLATLVFFLVMTSAAVTTYFMPRLFYSKVTMEVKPDKSGSIDVFGSNNRVVADPTFVSTQFQILQKSEILLPVIQSLRLREDWQIDGKELPMQEVYRKLRGMMDLREVRNTGLIEVGIYSVKPKEAMLIANRIAEIYQEKRLADMQKNLDRGLKQLQEEVEKQRRRVEEASASMAKIRTRDAINDPDPESFNSVLSAADRNIVALEQQTSAQQLVVTKLQGQIEQIKEMRPDELKEVLRTLNIEDQTVIKMVSNLQDAVSEEAKLSNNGLGENHPRIRALRAQREVFSKQLTISLETVRQSQAYKLNIEERTLSNLLSKFDEAKQSQIKDKQVVAAYADAKSQYLQSKKIFDAAQIKYSTELLERGIDFEPAKIWERAEEELYPRKPNVPAYMLLAMLIGGTMGVGMAFFIEYMDTSVKTLEDVEKYLQQSVLAIIPKNVSELINTRGDSRDAEAYRILRANLEFNKPDRNANTFTLVSGGPGEGKSTTLNNLAYTCAKGGYRVLVVDADLRRPTQHKFFKQENRIGLTDYLLGRATLPEVTKTTALENLFFIPSGLLPDEAVGILNSQRMAELIALVKSQYDLIFFDSPPILGVSDGSVLASECEMTIMVIQHRRFPRSMLLRVKQAVAHAGGRLVGVVLNSVDERHDEGYYSTYNDYYTKPQTAEEAKLLRPAPKSPRNADY